VGGSARFDRDDAFNGGVVGRKPEDKIFTFRFD
jgi:hypothetical protein